MLSGRFDEAVAIAFFKLVNNVNGFSNKGLMEKSGADYEKYQHNLDVSRAG